MDAHSSTVTDVTSASSDSDMDAHSSTATSALVPPPANETNAAAATAAPAAAGGAEVYEFEGMAFMVTEGNKIAEVLQDGSLRVLESESYFEEDTGTQEHFLDVDAEMESMLFLVSVREDQRRIVRMVRWF
ncbi:hypothetical protein EJB05_47902, partial [Eragrostis curvula]